MSDRRGAAAREGACAPQRNRIRPHENDQEAAAPDHARRPADLADSGRGGAGRDRRPALLWFGDYTAKVQWTLTLLIAGCGLGFILSAREHIVRPLQTMTNLLAALREGDYSIRARGARADDALGEALLEINALGETLRLQRFGAFEATALLRTIMAEIDVAVFTFDPDRRLRLVNRAGEDLLGQPIDKLLGRRASDLGLDVCLDADRGRAADPHVSRAARGDGACAEVLFANAVCRTSCWC